MWIRRIRISVFRNDYSQTAFDADKTSWIGGRREVHERNSMIFGLFGMWFRRLWIARINAAVRVHGLSYSQFIHGLSKAQVEINRKVLADLAVTDSDAFAAIAQQAKANL